MTNSYVKKYLINEIEVTAEWRHEKADQYPGDVRNRVVRTRSNISRGDEDQKTIRDDHPLRVMLAEFWTMEDRTEPDQIIPRWGFDSEEPDGAEALLRDSSRTCK